LRSRLSTLILLVVALGVTTIAYRPSLEAGFYFDDQPNITEAPALQWEELPSGDWLESLAAPQHPERVVPNVTFALNHLVGGLNPRGYHLVNLLIHLLMGLAVAWAAYLMASECDSDSAGAGLALSEVGRIGPLAAALAAALYLLHPLNIQAVTYVVQRMASLAALFGVLSFCLYVVGRRASSSSRSRLLLVLAGLAWLLALGSKQNALMVPVVLMAYEACFHGAIWRDRLRAMLADRRRRWWLAAVLGSGVLAVLLVNWLYLGGITPSWTETYPTRDFSGWQRVLTQARVHWFYLSLLIWPSPSRLNLDHDFAVSGSLLEPLTLVAVLAWAAAVLVVLWVARRRPRYGFPLLAYLLLHGAESGPVNLELVFEHRMYLPMAFLAVLFAVVLVDLTPRWRRFALAGAALALVPLAVATYQRNLTWSDSVQFHADCVQKSPNKPRPHNNFATILHGEGRFEEARREFEVALKLKPESLNAHVGLGKTLTEIGLYEEAERHYRLAAQLYPHVALPHLELGNLLLRKGRLADAVEAFRRAVARDPNAWGTRYTLGLALLKGGNAADAVQELRVAQSLIPTWSATYRPLGDAYRALGQQEEALSQYRQALRREGETAVLHFNIGTVSGELGRWNDARSHLLRSVELDEQQSQAHNNLANVFLQTGEVKRAVKHYEDSVRLDPANLQARMNLASTYRRLGMTREAAEQQQLINTMRSAAEKAPALR
jgi:tetratricopeptide (TPR) repeat protein